jgi:hypothetical protein
MGMLYVKSSVASTIIGIGQLLDPVKPNYHGRMDAPDVKTLSPKITKIKVVCKCAENNIVTSGKTIRNSA